MATKSAIFVIFILGIAMARGDNTTPQPATDAPTTGPPSTSAMTTVAPTTSPTTAAKSTTASTTGTTTTVPTETMGTGTTPNATSSIGTTEPPVTTPTTKATTTTPAPPEIGTWTVRSATDNTTCMMMSFKGTINRMDTATSFLIPTTAMSDSSICTDDVSTFVLNFMDENSTSVSVSLNFVMQDKETSYMYSSSIMYDNMTEAKIQILFETPAGNSYQCDQTTVPFGETYSLTLETLRLQPFSSFADDKQFGKSHSCVEPSSKKGPSAATITGLVLGFIIFILLIAVVVLYRKKKGPGRGYNNFS